METPTNEPAPVAAEPQSPMTATMWNDRALMERAWKQANTLSRSALVPEQLYQGKPENCLIALDIANRTGFSPLMVMQGLTIVKGKPAWNGQTSIALVNGCGRFTPLTFIYSGEGDDFGCTAQAKRLSDGEICESERITMRMANDEGWTSHAGSKWKTFPRQMMMYRSGAFFARTYCPDVLMGIYTVDELNDVGKGDVPAEKVVVTVE